MATEVEEFFRRILPSVGFPVVTTLRAKTYPQQFSCESLADFFRALGVQKQKCNEQYRELYFGLSTVEQRFVINAAGVVQVRPASNCRYIRVLALDVDIDPIGFLKGDTDVPCYHTQEDAIAGVKAFANKIGFNQPYIVSSGYGLHVYWPFEEHIDTDEWWLLAQRFKAVCAFVDCRLIADQSRVTDRAGILRVPASWNFKVEADPREVRILEDCAHIPWPHTFYSEALDFFIKANGVGLNFVLPRAGTGPKIKKATMKALVDLDVDFPDKEKADFKEIYKKCNWVKDWMEHPAERREPAWKCIVDLSVHTKFIMKDGTVCEGRDLAIFVSKAYPGYDEAETIKKYDLAAANPKLASRYCTSLQVAKSSPCNTCLYREHVNTPLSLPSISLPVAEVKVETPIIVAGQAVAVEERTFPRPPFPYEIGEDGGVYMRMKNPETGEKSATKRIYEYTLLPVARIRDENSDNDFIEVEIKLPHNVTRRFQILGGDLQDEKAVRRILGNKGVLAQKAEMDALVKYIIAYAAVIQRAEPAKNNYNTFGWKERNTLDSKFVFYDAVVKPGGLIVPYKNTVHSLRDIGPYASARGSLDKWKEAFRIYEDVEGMEPYIINLMLSFGAPLLAFLNEFGMIYNLYGSGGEGKSSSILIATSVWGLPSVGHALAHDTAASILDTMGTLSSIPMAFDELTKMPAGVLSEFAYTLSNGRGKNRLKESGERRLNNYHWQTFVLGSSNHSLYGKLAELPAGNDAHGYRILELESPPGNVEVNKRMNEVKHILNENYGVAGREYMRYVLENIEVVTAKTREARDNYSDPTRGKERFWIAAQACIQTAGYITKDMGLHNYEAGKLLEYMERMAPRAAIQSIAGDPVSKLNDYMMQNLNNTIKIVDEQVVNLDLDFVRLNSIGVRLESSGGQVVRAFIPSGSIERWCKNNDVDVTWLRSELMKTKVILRITKKRMGVGTKFFSVMANCWELDMQHPLVTGVARKDLERPNVIQLMGEGK